MIKEKPWEITIDLTGPDDNVLWSIDDMLLQEMIIAKYYM